MIHLLAQAHQEVVWLHVSVDEVLSMNELNPTYELVRQQEDSLEAELPVAEVEEVLQAGPQQLHHHHVVLALAAVVLDKGNPNTSLHHLKGDLLFVIIWFVSLKLDDSILSLKECLQSDSSGPNLALI